MKRALAALAALILLAVALPAPAHGHAAFIVSNPAPDSSVGALPEQLTITFSESVSRAGTLILVIGPDGAPVSGEMTVEANVASTVLTGGGPGTYLVTWSNVSLDDGHEASGTFSFTVTG
jgi:methionine-rich copper-binding protein CopC